MPVNPRLVTARGAQFHIQTMTDQQTTPTTVTFTTGASATAIGATTITGVTTPAGNTKIFNEGMILVCRPNTADAQFIYLAATTANGTPTTLTVEPLVRAIPANTAITSFVGIPVIGLESANMQLQNEVNQAVLLANQGWQVTDASTGSFQFDGTLYTPRQSVYNAGARAVVDALIAKASVYVERFLPDGTYNAGSCVVTNASDTVSGAQYISRQVTLQGSNQPLNQRLFDA